VLRFVRDFSAARVTTEPYQAQWVGSETALPESRVRKDAPSAARLRLRQIEVEIANGKTAPQAWKEAENTRRLPKVTTPHALLNREHR
jgi:hypothetical protein